MLMPLAIAILSGLLAAVVPSPAVWALAGCGLVSGYHLSLAAAAGAALGISMSFAFALYGYMPGDYFFLAFTLAAAIFLGYLGYRYWRASSTQMPPTGSSYAGLCFLIPLAIIVTSPKVIVFFYGWVLSTEFNTLGIGSRILLVVAVGAAAMAVLVLYAVLVSWLRKFLSSRLEIKRIYQAAAVLMAWTAVCVVVR